MAVRHQDEVLPTKHDVIAEASFVVKKIFWNRRSAAAF